MGINHSHFHTVSALRYVETSERQRIAKEQILRNELHEAKAKLQETQRRINELEMILFYTSPRP
jgi:hypothetical protein